jgi:hypothetical protein
MNDYNEIEMAQWSVGQLRPKFPHIVLEVEGEIQKKIIIIWTRNWSNQESIPGPLHEIRLHYSNSVDFSRLKFQIRYLHIRVALFFNAILIIPKLHKYRI